jgi:hypothetical protein
LSKKSVVEEVAAALEDANEVKDLADISAKLYAKQVWGIELDPQKLPRVVGLAGPIGAGKSTAARALGMLGYRVASFATPLKAVCYQIFAPLGAEYRHFFGSQADKAELIANLGTSGRRILELVGTEGFRAAVPDVWVRAGLVPRFPGERIVLDDVRYENEAFALREAGGLIIHLNRLGHEPPRTGHKSDAGLVHDYHDAALVVADGDLVGLGAETVKAVLRKAGALAV